MIVILMLRQELISPWTTLIAENDVWFSNDIILLQLNRLPSKIRLLSFILSAYSTCSGFTSRILLNVYQ